MSIRFLNIAVAAQCALVASAMATFALWPPERGAMILVSTDGPLARPINVALAAGAAIVGQGPVPRSVIVVGDRGRIYDQARRVHLSLVALAAPAGLCEPAANKQAGA